jgi:flagellar assembly protein FliH
MLSKVLSGREAERAQPLVFSFATAETMVPPNRDSPAKKDDAGEEENRILRASVERLQHELAAAKRDAFESGRQAGEQKARAEIAPVMERVNASIADLTGMRQELRRRAEKDVVQLSLLIARRVLHRELNVDTSALTALARVVFERLARAESYRVTVHPQFAASIQAALSGRLSSRIEIDADAASPPGTFLIRSEEGSIDASVDTQLEEIGRGLTDRLAGI